MIGLIKRYILGDTNNYNKYLLNNIQAFLVNISGQNKYIKYSLQPLSAEWNIEYYLLSNLNTKLSSHNKDQFNLRTQSLNEIVSMESKQKAFNIILSRIKKNKHKLC